MRKKYTVSDRVIKNYWSMTRMDKWVRILTLRNQGWTFQAIANELGCSKASAHEVYNKAKRYTVDKLAHIYNLLLDTTK